MAIVIATTTIDVIGHRPPLNDDPGAEGWDNPSPDATIVSHDVRACITIGSAIRNAAERFGLHNSPITLETDIRYLRCDPCDINNFDIVTDKTTGAQYTIEEILDSDIQQYGLEHKYGRLRIFKGVAS